MNYTFDQYRQSADALLAKLGDFRPKVALVLGSGLGYLGDLVRTPPPSPTPPSPTLRPPPPRDTRGSWSSAPWPASRWR